MRILIADDHAVVRHGIRRILADEFSGVVFGEAGTTQDAIAQLWDHNWDVIILDISMPGRSGMDVLAETRKRQSKTPVLVLSMHPEDQFAMRVLKSGAAGYMTKETAPEALIDAVKKVIAGGRYVSPTLGERMASFIGLDFESPPHEALSNREFQVLRMIASGMTVGEVGKELDLSVKTVSTYRSRILEKMVMRTNAELTHYAIQNRLVE